MLVNHGLLAERSSFVADGIEERGLFVDVGGGRCYCILYSPREPADLGFVLCHPFGQDIWTLRRMERHIARALARGGYPVVAFQTRGYGDSTGDPVDATLQVHREDLRAAASLLAEQTRVARLGLLGARFGGLLAGLAARDGAADRLVLINPAISGTTNFQQLMKDMQILRTTIPGAGPAPTVEEILRVMRERGVADVLGHPIYRHLYDALAEVSLTEDMGSFSGNALLVQVSKSARTRREFEALAARIEAGGGTSRIEFVPEPPGATFGGPVFKAQDDGAVRLDVQEPIAVKISELILEWLS